jgi:hypothetical protein
MADQLTLEFPAGTTYQVRTWSFETETWTAQEDLPTVWTKWGLRKAIRRLRQMGYGYGRCDMLCALIEKMEAQ